MAGHGWNHEFRWRDDCTRRRGTAVTDLKGRGERMSTKEKKLVRFGKWKEFLPHRLCFLLNGAGWELNWGFKESKEGW